MFKFPGGLGDMLKQAQQFQENAEQFKRSLDEMRLEGDAGAGMVRVVVTGACEVLEVQLDPRLLDAPDQEMIQDLVREASNDALRKAKELMKQELSKLSGGLPIPGMS